MLYGIYTFNDDNILPTLFSNYDYVKHFGNLRGMMVRYYYEYNIYNYSHVKYHNILIIILWYLQNSILILLSILKIK